MEYQENKNAALRESYTSKSIKNNLNIKKKRDKAISLIPSKLLNKL